MIFRGMEEAMEIRSERPEDVLEIRRLTTSAFEHMPFSDGTEADCIDKLRADNDLTLSLVAVEEDDVVGHIAFSPVSLTESLDGWVGLGPVSVWPVRQRKGIGGLLINRGLELLRDREVPGCVLIGDPNYYSRFGFVGDGRIAYRALPKEVVQWLAFSDLPPSGVLKFSPGLE